MLQILTIGDCTKSETRGFFRDRIIPHVPPRLRVGLSFDQLWDAFGGKLAHWQDYITDYGGPSVHPGCLDTNTDDIHISQ